MRRYSALDPEARKSRKPSGEREALSSRTNDSDDLLLLLTVDLGNNHLEQLPVRLGDEPSALAKAFCAKHKLPLHLCEVLTETIETNTKQRKAQERLEIFFEPVHWSLRTEIQRQRVRNERWMKEEGLPAMTCLALALWKMHAHKLLHLGISLDTIYLTKEGIYKFGHFLACSRMDFIHDLRQYTDIRCLGFVFASFLSGLADIDDGNRDRCRESLRNANSTVREIIEKMTEEQVADQYTAEEAFLALYRLLHADDERPVQEQRQGIREANPFPLSFVRPSQESSLDAKLMELQKAINAPQPLSDEFIMEVISTTSDLLREEGGVIRAEIKETQGKCNICNKTLRLKHMVKYDAKHSICFTCVNNNAKDRGEKFVYCAACRQNCDLSAERICSRLPAALQELIRSL